MAKNGGRDPAGLLETANLPGAFPEAQCQEIRTDVGHGMKVVESQVAQMGNTEHIESQADPPRPDEVPDLIPQVTPAGDRYNLQRGFRPGPISVAEHEQPGILLGTDPENPLLHRAGKVEPVHPGGEEGPPKPTGRQPGSQ